MGLSAMHRLSLVGASGGSSLAAICRLISVAAAHGLSSSGCWALEHSSVGVVHGLSCTAACGIFPDKGSNPCRLHWQADSLPLSHSECPGVCTLNKFAGDADAAGLGATV